MEYEVSFYYNQSEIEKIIERLKSNPKLHSNLKIYEKTILYNHSDKDYDFYTKEVNGRLRLRISKNNLTNKCRLSWKQKINDSTDSDVNKELIKKVTINPSDIDNLIYIIENVMHFKVVENYERYRTIFENNDIQIAVDEYPFGICLEIENKSINKNPIEVVKYWIEQLGLNIEEAYRLSWDYKYEELCHEQGIDSYKEVTFDKPMPVIDNKFN